MATTPRPVIDSVVRSVCGREVERLVRFIVRGLHEAYRVEVRNDSPVVIRKSRVSRRHGSGMRRERLGAGARGRRADTGRDRPLRRLVNTPLTTRRRIASDEAPTGHPGLVKRALVIECGPSRSRR